VGQHTKLVSTDGLDVTKGEVLVDVQVVENLVVSCAKGDVVRGFEGSQNTCNGNPLVDVRTGAGHADVRLGGLWNRHVWKKDTRARAGRFIKYQNR
jgi:hypothetical protein